MKSDEPNGRLAQGPETEGSLECRGEKRASLHSPVLSACACTVQQQRQWHVVSWVEFWGFSRHFYRRLVSLHRRDLH